MNAIDTNGAGDMFAGAVINKLNNGNNLAESAKFGCFAASKIVQEIGPRLSKEGYKKIKRFLAFKNYSDKLLRLRR